MVQYGLWIIYIALRAGASWLGFMEFNGLRPKARCLSVVGYLMYNCVY